MNGILKEKQLKVIYNWITDFLNKSIIMHTIFKIEIIKKD